MIPFVVDHGPEQRDTASAILKRLECTVDSVPGGNDAVACFRGRNADLMVRDTLMGPGNGRLS
ncbi:MAG TPA: hypothetical protein VLT88_03620 [Desulfosarcina sp.]|nr:hypothetical protein [Desulfosarcina sp.]